MAINRNATSLELRNGGLISGLDRWLDLQLWLNLTSRATIGPTLAESTNFHGPAPLSPPRRFLSCPRTVLMRVQRTPTTDRGCRMSSPTRLVLSLRAGSVAFSTGNFLHFVP